jgi:hypothetical protein
MMMRRRRRRKKTTMMTAATTVVYTQYDTFDFSPHIFVNMSLWVQKRKIVYGLFFTLSSEYVKTNPLPKVTPKYSTSVGSSIVILKRVDSLTFKLSSPAKELPAGNTKAAWSMW